MKTRNGLVALIIVLVGLHLAACSPSPAAPPTETPRSTPEWFDMELTDARTGESFTINDFSGKVVLVESMAMWCPGCLTQAREVRKLHELLGDRDDLVSVSLDVDVNEDQASIKKYVEEYGFDWRFSVAPLGVARALGNLYTAQYLNPPLSPMMIIDRDGNVHHLEYGQKSAETLFEHVEPYLVP